MMAHFTIRKLTTKTTDECYVQMKFMTPTSLFKWKTLYEDVGMSRDEWTGATKHLFMQDENCNNSSIK